MWIHLARSKASWLPLKFPYVLPGICTQEITSGMLAVSSIAELDDA